MTLLAILNPATTVQVRVDTTVYDVRKGQHFHHHYSVVKIGTNCATFAYASQTFRLCEPQQS